MSKKHTDSQRIAVVRTRAMPADINPAGDIFGGWLMSQMDMAGEITARQRSRTRVVTVAVKAMTFQKPVHVGDVVSCFAEITRVGNTSITVKVEVVVIRQDSGDIVPVTEGVYVYVALDSAGNPTVVPPID